MFEIDNDEEDMELQELLDSMDPAPDVGQEVGSLPEPDVFVAEEKRCPQCRGLLLEERDDNGVLGPGYLSWVTGYTCSECAGRFGRNLP